MIVALRPRLLLSRPAAARVSYVDCPLTCNTRANASSRPERSGTERVVTAPIPECLEIPVAEVSGGRGDIRFHHLGGINHAIEFLLCDETQFQSSCLERQVVVQGIVSDVRCFVVADDR